MSENSLCNFIKFFEEKYNAEVPVNIKKTLEIMEYSRYTLSIANPEDLIAEIEETIRNVLPTCIDDFEKENYYGKLFKNCPEKFKFFDGQKSLLRNLVRFAFLDMKDSNKNTKEIRKRKITNTEEDESNFEKEVQNCKKLVIEWFKNNLGIDVKDCKIHNLKITKVEIHLFVECPLCFSKYSAHKLIGNADKGWFISNLYRHAKSAHFENGNKNRRSKDNTQPISNFFLHSVEEENDKSVELNGKECNSNDFY